MAILIAGIVAAIAIPVFNGQRLKAKNAAAREAIVAAIHAANGQFAGREGYDGITAAGLSGLESTLTGTSAAVTPGAAADPRTIYVASDNAGTPPTSSTVILCSASKGDETYCAQGIDGRWTYLKIQGGSNGLNPGDFADNGWNSTPVVSAPLTPEEQHAAVILADNPQIYWRLEESAPVDDQWAFDNAASATTGQLAADGLKKPNSSSTASGKFGRAMQFAGVNGLGSGVIDSWGHSKFSGTAGAKTTVEAWVKWDGTYGTGARAIYSFDFYNLIFWNNAGTPRLCFNTYNADCVGFSGASVTNLAGGWHHIAAVFVNGVPSTGNVKLYVDGVAQTLGVIGTPLSRNVTSDTHFFRVGGLRGSNNTTADATNRFSGTIDEVAVFNGELTAGQIAAHAAG